MWKSLRLALAALAVASATPVAARAQPPVWIVRDADSEMLLFGSIHVLPPRLNWIPPILTNTLKTADDVWFELPMDPGTEIEVAQLAYQHGVLPPSQSLTKLLGAREAGRLSRVAQAYGASMATLDRLEPWYAEVALAMAYYQKAGGDPSLGVEKTVAADLPPEILRRAFETPAEQISLFDGAPLAEQIASLDETLGDMESRPDQYKALVDAWMSGDAAALDREALEPLREASPALFRRLVVDRNVRWVETLRERLAGSGRTVVVVGVGHLVGADGLPARLRALGYSVEGP
jgi:uncharacterized protein YbaP (TraB family)